MKHKSSKRSNSNKHPQNNTSSTIQARRLSNSSTGAVDVRAKSSSKAGCLDSNISCFKANLTLKSQKVLKRDLLRCSEQPPSLLGSHALRTPRSHHAFQHMHSLTSSSTSSSISHGQPLRRRSFSADPYLPCTTTDRLGPWLDLTTNRFASAGSDSLNPVKNCRKVKNPRVFSPKYYASLADNTSKFKYHTSTETYIDEYRRQKGYLLDVHTIAKSNLRSLLIQQSDEEPLYAVDIPNDTSDQHTDTTTERTILTTTDRLTASTTELSTRQNALTKSTSNFFDHTNIPPSIPTLKKIFNESHHMNNFPAISLRHGHLRSTRHSHQHHSGAHQSQQQQTIALPPLNASSLQYINGINSFDRVYSNSKKPSIQNHSKFFLLEGRNKRRISQRANNDSEAASRSQDYSELRATGGPVVTTTQRTAALIAYQLPRLPPTLVTNQNDIG